MISLALLGVRDNEPIETPRKKERKKKPRNMTRDNGS
jgi:hypothetical protein